ncbi:MAG: helix-turn-helix transcriptional regulator [Mesorhizobium sp.]|uniref:helix-turn-helix domain-containing protein n=1 Tax=unclassified Mesorhizobium TaxID=325217 RepID=UPI000FCC43BD|nr:MULTISPECIES: helix-turn-helix transcriptional regulator [unclassified Mesorhizobium]RUV65200.1 XRE family transcriptional regulator [Mesorhizobium sp. M5C.F.Ca.IN.020.29.1.1]TIM87640.1 MAG: helix-turn-helix transcriptional regulator [Mesorhizobium sp.]TIR33309.1 MAG: helix-turn-helix transcriptional regulator [Mesorhizobium sp.]
MANFGDRVREERTARNWSLQELADRVTKAAGIECPRVTIEKIESRSSKKSEWSSAIAAAFNVDHDWLLTGKGQKEIAKVSIDKQLRGFRPEVADRLKAQINALIDNEKQRSDQ